MNGYEVFLSIVNMGLTASVVIIAVLIARGLMGRLPKKYLYMMWLIVGIRLVCPVMISSSFSVFNLPGLSHEMALYPADIKDVAAQYTKRDAKKADDSYNPANVMKQEQGVVSGKGDEKPAQSDMQEEKAVNQTVNAEKVKSQVKSDTGVSLSPFIKGGTIVWIGGMLALFLWNAYLTIRMRGRLQKAVRYDENIYECDNIPTPFVMGLLHPRIYIPFHLQESEREYILKHEQYHIKRKDYLVKLAAMLLVIVYWFHPLVWVSYFCMVRDMEMSCDEYVLGVVKQDIRANYSESLLGFATNTRHLSIGLLAFGETYTRKRVKNIMKFQNYKKWIGIVAAMLVFVVGAVCLTNAKADNGEPAGESADVAVTKNQDGKYKVVIADAAIHDYEIQLSYLSEKMKPKAEDGIYNGEFVLETTKNGKIYDEYVLKFPSKDTLAFPAAGMQLVVKDYDGDEEMDDFSLGQGEQVMPELGNWMQYEFFTVEEDGSIVQFVLSTEDGNSILTLPGEYSGDFERKDGEVYYTGFGEDGEAENMTTGIMRADEILDDAKETEKIYQDFIEELRKEKEYKDAIYTATMKSGQGEDILLVAEAVMSDNTTARAAVYQCVGGRVVFVGYAASTGSGYPLCKDGEWIVSGFHHSSEKLRVDYGVGTAYEVEGFGLGNGSGSINKYIVKEDERILVDIRDITEEEAGELDYYMADENYTKTIVFTEVK